MPIKDYKKIIYPKDMKNLRKGDRFTEMYNFWLYIIKTCGDYVTVIYASAPCKFPDDGIVEQMRKEDFRKRFDFIWLVDRFNKFDKWDWSKKKNEYIPLNMKIDTQSQEMLMSCIEDVFCGKSLPEPP